MKNPKENSLRWLRQSGFDLKQSEKSLSDKSFSYACFFAEQSSQKSTKAFLISKGQRIINIHSIAELLKESAKFEEEFEKFIDSGKKLDLYYLSSRYPDAVPEPAIPAEIYIEEQAKDALEIASKIFELCKTKINL